MDVKMKDFAGGHPRIGVSHNLAVENVIQMSRSSPSWSLAIRLGGHG
jgi:hypothetical protein